MARSRSQIVDVAATGVNDLDKELFEANNFAGQLLAQPPTNFVVGFSQAFQASLVARRQQGILYLMGHREEDCFAGIDILLFDQCDLLVGIRHHFDDFDGVKKSGETLKALFIDLFAVPLEDSTGLAVFKMKIS